MKWKDFRTHQIRTATFLMISVTVLGVLSVLPIWTASAQTCGGGRTDIPQDLTQLQVYNQTIANFTSPSASSPPQNLTGTVDETLTLKFSEIICYQVSGHGQSVNGTLLSQGFIPDCLTNCTNGIRYWKDPTTLITNQGRGVEQCLIYGTTLTDTCTAGNFPIYIGWTTNNHAIAVTDTWAGGVNVPCSSSNLIVDANGLRDVAGTVTAGANGASVTTTISKTFSITGTYSGVDASCVLSGTGTNADSGTNPLLYAEGTMGPDTFASGDQLTGTWIFVRS